MAWSRQPAPEDARGGNACTGDRWGRPLQQKLFLMGNAVEAWLVDLEKVQVRLLLLQISSFQSSGNS